MLCVFLHIFLNAFMFVNHFYVHYHKEINNIHYYYLNNNFLFNFQNYFKKFLNIRGR